MSCPNKRKRSSTYAHTFALESSISTSKFEVSDGLLTSGMYGATAERTKKNDKLLWGSMDLFSNVTLLGWWNTSITTYCHQGCPNQSLQRKDDFESHQFHFDPVAAPFYSTVWKYNGKKIRSITLNSLIFWRRKVRAWRLCYLTKYSILVTSCVEVKSVSKPSGQSVVCVSVMYLCSLHTCLEVAHQAGAYPGFL